MFLLTLQSSWNVIYWYRVQTDLTKYLPVSSFQLWFSPHIFIFVLKITKYIEHGYDLTYCIMKERKKGKLKPIDIEYIVLLKLIYIICISAIEMFLTSCNYSNLQRWWQQIWFYPLLSLINISYQFISIAYYIVDMSYMIVYTVQLFYFGSLP